MSLHNILIRELREKKAKEKAERDAAIRYREDNMHLIVNEFKDVLTKELDGYGVRVYINKTQNNVECEDGDKFFLTASKKHTTIRTEFRVSNRVPSAEFMNIFRQQSGINDATVTKDGKTHFTVQFMTPQEEVPSTIRRILTRVKPMVAVQ